MCLNTLTCGESGGSGGSLHHSQSCWAGTPIHLTSVHLLHNTHDLLISSRHVLGINHECATNRTFFASVSDTKLLATALVLCSSYLPSDCSVGSPGTAGEACTVPHCDFAVLNPLCDIEGLWKRGRERNCISLPAITNRGCYLKMAVITDQ